MQSVQGDIFRVVTLYKVIYFVVFRTTRRQEKSVKIFPEVEQKGWIFIKAYHSDISGNDVFSMLGDPFDSNNNEGVHRLSPRLKCESEPNSYSSLYGVDAFPFHTDMAHWRNPPRYVMLRCVRGFREVSTYLLDGNSIIKKIDPDILQRSLVQPRRAIKGRMPLFHLYQEQKGGNLLRWDEVFIRPASLTGKMGWKAMSEAIKETKPIDIVLFQKGDTLIFDNWRMLHARSAVPPTGMERQVDRAYLRGLK